MTRYQVTTFDVCMSGNERLRNRDEFILVAEIAPGDSAAALEQQWLDQLDSCDRPSDFDFDAVRDCVKSYVSGRLAPFMEGHAPNPFSLDEPAEDGEDELCKAFLFIADTREA